MDPPIRRQIWLPVNSSFEVITTLDGSLTFYSEEFGQTYHNRSGARQEALEKFVLPCHLDRLPERQGRIRILDICFGLGYNTGVALELIGQTSATCRVELIGLERSPEVAHRAWEQGIRFGLTPEDHQKWFTLLKKGESRSPRFQAQLLWGDARHTLDQVSLGWADAVFLDPFSPSVCPELWTVDFLTQVGRRMSPNGRLTTYSCSAAVRAALIAAGLAIGSTPPVGRPWPGTVASFDPSDLPPLSPSEQEHLATRAAIPFRDPDRCADRDQIRQIRQREQQLSTLEPTSVWKRRWE